VGTFIKQMRHGGSVPDETPIVTFRSQAIAFNAAFVAKANLEEAARVTVFLDDADYRVGLKFHNDVQESDSYTLTSDGGSRTRGRCIQPTALIKRVPWLRAITMDPNARRRRFVPKWVREEGLWTIAVYPCFEIRVSDRSEIPHKVRGIYRYMRDAEVVYVGRGHVRSRATSPDRANWDFDTIEYSLVEGEAEQAKWEAFWLDEFVRDRGKLPIYNRLKGTHVVSTTAGSE
jgi:hypothetical protein